MDSPREDLGFPRAGCLALESNPGRSAWTEAVVRWAEALLRAALTLEGVHIQFSRYIHQLLVMLNLDRFPRRAVAGLRIASMPAPGRNAHLDAPPLAVKTAASALGMGPPLQSLLPRWVGAV